MTRTNDRSDVIYDDSIPDHEIITIHGDVLIERMEELGLSTDYEDDWSDLLVRMYRVPDGPERVFVAHQIEGVLAQAMKARGGG